MLLNIVVLGAVLLPWVALPLVLVYGAWRWIRMSASERAMYRHLHTGTSRSSWSTILSRGTDLMPWE